MQKYTFSFQLIATIYNFLKSQIDEGFAEDDLEANLQRDKYARLCNTVNQLIDELTPVAPDFQLRDACDQLVCYQVIPFAFSKRRISN